jgi:hypothetical protein
MSSGCSLIKKSKFSTPSANLGGLSLVQMNPFKRTYRNNIKGREKGEERKD